VIKKHCPEEPYLKKWAKRRQNNNIIARRANLSALNSKDFNPPQKHWAGGDTGYNTD